MNNFRARQFLGLLKREFLEHRGLFISAPAGLALIIFVASVWVMSQLDAETIAVGIEYLAVLFDGLSPLEMAPLFLILAVPFMITLYICGFIYFMNTLYQDRRDSSVLFWQSMPVSNLTTVVSKIVTFGMVAPLSYIAILFAMYLVGMSWLSVLGLNYSIDVAGLGYMFMAAVVSLMLMYLSVIFACLWLLPTIGWILLFSAFARRTPIMWALGVFIMVGFTEEFVFGSQFLANWVQSRSNPAQYLILGFDDVIPRLFNYDMLFGILVGSILVTGAVLMRRFVD